MTTLFDGMAGMANGVFGATVTILPVVGGSYDLHATFRDTPIEVLTDDGRGVLQQEVTLSVPRNLIGSLSEGDQVRPASGRLFRIVNGQPNGSPADDGFVIYELEEVLP